MPSLAQLQCRRRIRATLFCCTHILHRASDVEHNSQLVHLLLLLGEPNLNLPLGHIGQNGLELVLALDHLAALEALAVHRWMASKLHTRWYETPQPMHLLGLLRWHPARQRAVSS